MSSDDAAHASDDDVVIRARDLGKAYLIFAKPQDRLKQMILRKRRYFDEYWAFQNLDLDVRRGETVGILGRNGSGKSTLLQVIAGTLRPTTGSVEVRGRIAPLLELGSGFNPEFTGLENVRVSAAVLGLTEAEIDTQTDSILAFAGIGDFVRQPVKTYSSGMHARLAFAVAAHVDAEILIVDEALAVGDAGFVQKCMRWLRAFKERGTVLFVSHDTNAVLALCDRAIWLDRGQLRADGSPQDVSLRYSAAIHGEGEGDAFSVKGRSRRAPLPRDVRHEALAASEARNAIEVFAFDADAPSFGQGGGRIEDVRLETLDGTPLSVLVGGEELRLVVTCQARDAIESPIVGFLVRDRLGQNLFGDNTYLTTRHAPLGIEAGERFSARFTFTMPYLPTGDFSMVAALAAGTQADHVQHHWVDEALLFRCESSHVAQGLIGIPMTDIALVQDAPEPAGASVAASA